MSKQSSKVRTIDKKQPVNEEYFSYLGSMITNDARCKIEVNSRIVTATHHSTRRRNFSPATGAYILERNI